MFVQIDHQDGSYLLCLELKNGRTVWKAEREGIYDNWSSPVVAEVESERQVICLGTREIRGYAWETGETLWVREGLERLCATTPLVEAGRLFAVSGPAGATLAFELRREGARLLWESKRDGPFIASPLIIDGLYFMVTDRGVVSCRDLDTGERYWQSRAGGQGRSSPVAAAGRVYLTDLEGRTTVIEANLVHRELAANHIGEGVASSAAISGKRLLLRGERHLFCIEDFDP